MKRLLAVLFLAIVAAPAVHAAPEKWFDAYTRGVKAVNSKNYGAAAEALQKAINETPSEGVNVRAGSSLITYVPHFWLGIAKFNLGDVDGALREWSISEQQGVISRTEYYAGMKEWIARAQTEKVRKAESAAKGPRNQADAAIRKAFATQVEALSAGGDRSDTYRSAQRKLQEALGQFNKAGTNIDAYRTAEETAGQALTLFSRAAEEAKAQKLARANAPKPKPVVQQSVVPQKQIASTVPPETKPVETRPALPLPVPQQAQQTPPAAAEPEVESEASVNARVNLQKYRSAVAKAQRDHKANGEVVAYLKVQEKETERLRQRLERARGRDGDLAQIAREAAERERSLFERISEIRTAAAATAALARPVDEPRDARAGLQTAYRAFAAGDLDTSEQLLTKIVTEAPSPEAYLLRGCARYTRAMLSRTPDALLAGAKDDFRQALQRNPKLRLDARLFSPKLVSFFDEVRVR